MHPTFFSTLFSSNCCNLHCDLSRIYTITLYALSLRYDKRISIALLMSPEVGFKKNTWVWRKLLVRVSKDDDLLDELSSYRSDSKEAILWNEDGYITSPCFWTHYILACAKRGWDEAQTQQVKEMYFCRLLVWEKRL